VYQLTDFFAVIVDFTGATSQEAASGAAGPSGDEVEGNAAGGAAGAPSFSVLAAAAAGAAPAVATSLSFSSSSSLTSALTSVRRDVDRLATQRTAAGLKPEKHGLVDLLMLKPPSPLPSSSFFNGNHHQQQQAREFVYNPTPIRDRQNQNNQNAGNYFGGGGGGGRGYSSAATAGGKHGYQLQQQQQPEPEVERRFVSVSNGSIFVASYFTLLETGGFVECSNVKRSATSEKVADLLKCTVEVRAGLRMSVDGVFENACVFF